MPAPTRPAATVVLLRPDGDGYRVFLVQRNRAVGFMPSAWVFPGGRVDEADRLVHPGLRGGDVALDRMGGDRDEGRAYLVAAVRETFEESGLWLGEGPPSAEVRAALCDGKVGLAAVLEGGAVADLDRLVPWSWWVTPEIEPRRYDTRFLVAVAKEGEASHDDGETVDSAWVTPAEAVAKAERGELPMAPPTWWTLTEMARTPTLEGVLQAAGERPWRPIMPIVTAAEDGAWELILPGHAEHPEGAFPGLPTRVRFAQGRWWAKD